MTENTIPSLQMKLNSLSAFAKPPVLPEGFAFRRASEADADALSRLLGRSFPEIVWTPDRAHRDFFEDETVKEVWVVETASAEGPVLAATTSARHFAPDAPGYVHWVGADPDHRGKLLGLRVTEQVLHRFREWGLDSAILETDDFRLPAIKTYLKLGFVPVLSHAAHTGYPERWSKIRIELEKSSRNDETRLRNAP